MTVHAKETQTETLVRGLRIKISKIVILNENDYIKIKPRECQELKMWREIGGIVIVQGFSWLANANDSCWIRVSDSNY